MATSSPAMTSGEIPQGLMNLSESPDFQITAFLLPLT
jgi:hypothetical protein